MLTKNHFKQDVSKEDIEKIKKFLTSKSKEVFLKRVCPEYAGALCEKVKIDINWDSMETNGWEQDYWLNAKYNDMPLLISGSGYYGYVVLSKDVKK